MVQHGTTALSAVSGLDTRRRWDLVLSIADTLHEESRSLNERLNEICQRLCSTLQIEAAAIFLADSKINRMLLRGAYGLSHRYVQVINDRKTIEIHPKPQEWAPTTRAFMTGEVVVINDVFCDNSFATWWDEAKREGYRSFVSVPLTANRRSIGCLNCYSTVPDRFGEAELDLLILLAHFLGIATELVQLNAMLAKQYDFLDRSQRIHDALTNAVLQNNAFQAVADTLGSLLGGEVLIYDRLYQLQASSAGATSSAAQWVGEQLAHRYRAGRVDHEPLILGASGAWQSNSARVLIKPVIVGRDVYGYVTLVKEAVKLDPLDIRAVEHAATIVALEFSNRQKASEAELRVEAYFLYELLTVGESAPDYLQRRAKQLGFPEAGSYQVLLFGVHGDEKDRGSYWNAFALTMVKNILTARGGRVLVGEKEGILVAVCAYSISHSMSIDDHALVEQVETTILGPNVRGKLQVAAGEIVYSLHEVSRSYHQARQALLIASRLGASRSIIRYDELGFYRFLLDTGASEELTEFTAKVLGPLLEYDEHHNLDLLNTVEAYLRHNCNVHETAKECHLHPNTVRYRLDRVAQLCQLDLACMDQMLELHLALKVYRLVGQERIRLAWSRICMSDTRERGVRALPGRGRRTAVGKGDRA